MCYKLNTRFMQISEFFENILEGFHQTSWLELAAVGFGVVQVFLSKANKLSNYYFGIVSILLTISVYFGARLYAEILLNLYYLVMSVYGIWYWKFKNKKERASIKMLFHYLSSNR